MAEKLLPELVILDVKMPILDGIAAAKQIPAKHIAPVVILTAFSQGELVERARDAGAMAYIVKPFTKADLVPAIEIAVSRFQELSALGAEVDTLRERLEVRKLLDRAKGRLQADSGLTEPEAFRWIQKTSMDRRGREGGWGGAGGSGAGASIRGEKGAVGHRPASWQTRREPGAPLVPCRPSPGRHVLYSVPRALAPP